MQTHFCLRPLHLPYALLGVFFLQIIDTTCSLKCMNFSLTTLSKIVNYREYREKEAGGNQKWCRVAGIFCWKQRNVSIVLLKTASSVLMAVLRNLGLHKGPLVLYCPTQRLPERPPKLILGGGCGVGGLHSGPLPLEEELGVGVHVRSYNFNA